MTSLWSLLLLLACCQRRSSKPTSGASGSNGAKKGGRSVKPQTRAKRQTKKGPRRRTMYSYRIVHDYGSAPNPFGGTMTLVICKPQIRRSAQPGDIVIGIDAQHRMTYVMFVTEKLTMHDYWTRAQNVMPFKIPNIHSAHYPDRVGDAIYDFSTDPVTQLPSVHTPEHMDTDLGGMYALLSTDFYHFGDQSVALPPHLEDIADVMRWYRSRLNDDLIDPFVQWFGPRMAELNLPHNHVGNPSMIFPQQ